MRYLLLVLLLALVAPATRAEDVDLAGFVADLGSTDATKRSAALTRLRALKDERAIGLLEEAAPGFDLFGRYYAVLVLESYPPERVARTFRRLAASEDPFLGLCGGAWFLRRDDARHVDVVVQALGTEGLDLNTRQYMVNRLYGVTDARVRDALRRLLVSGESTVLLGSVLQVLQTPEEEETKAAATRLLAGDDRADVRALAAALLYRYGEEARKAELAEALGDEGLTTTAFVRVRSFLQQSGHVATVILDAVTEALDETKNVILLRYFVEFLAQYKHRPALARLKALARHENASVAKAAFEGLVEMGDGLDREDLRALLTSKDAERRLAAADLLRRMDDHSGFDVVVQVLREGERIQRREAATALGLFRQRRAVDPLIDAMLDEDSYVRSGALSAVDQLLRALFPYRRLDLVAAGYAADAPEAQRKVAVDRIRAWWATHRDGSW